MKNSQRYYTASKNITEYEETTGRTAGDTEKVFAELLEALINKAYEDGYRAGYAAAKQ